MTACIVKALDSTVPGKILYVNAEGIDHAEVTVEYTVHTNKFLARFDMITGDEIPSGYDRPVFAPFAEPLTFKQLGEV